MTTLAMAPGTTAYDWRALDRLSARTGGILSALVREHSPVVFGCRYSPEDMVMLDLIGRYRFPVRVIAWENGLSAETSASFAEFVARRYVFAAPLTRVRDERAVAGSGATDAATFERLAITFTGCRGWISANRNRGAGLRHDRVWSGDEAHGVVRVAPLTDWSDDDVHGYIERWELPHRPAQLV